MESNELKAVQSPLKEKYRKEPESALVKFLAKGKTGENITCTIQGGSLTEAGLHPAAGGSGEHKCSGDMLLEALAACAGVTLNAVASSMGIRLKHAEVHAEGEIDFRGTLAVSRDVPVGFKNLKLKYILQTDASEEQLSSLIKLTERYCVIYQTLKSPPPIDTSFEKHLI
jgi:uncharacterized OsmC-like protein